MKLVKNSYTFKHDNLGPGDIELTIDMFTTMGLTNAQLGPRPVQEPEKRKPNNKKYSETNDSIDTDNIGPSIRRIRQDLE